MPGTRLLLLLLTGGQDERLIAPAVPVERVEAVRRGGRRAAVELQRPTHKLLLVLIVRLLLVALPHATHELLIHPEAHGVGALALLLASQGGARARRRCKCPMVEEAAVVFVVKVLLLLLVGILTVVQWLALTLAIDIAKTCGAVHEGLGGATLLVRAQISAHGRPAASRHLCLVIDHLRVHQAHVSAHLALAALKGAHHWLLSETPGWLAASS